MEQTTNQHYTGTNRKFYWDQDNKPDTLTLRHHQSCDNYCVSVMFLPSVRCTSNNPEKPQMNNKLTDSARINYFISSIRKWIFSSTHPFILPAIHFQNMEDTQVPSAHTAATTVLLNEYPTRINSHLPVWPLNFMCLDSCSGLNAQAQLTKQLSGQSRRGREHSDTANQYWIWIFSSGEGKKKGNCSRSTAAVVYQRHYGKPAASKTHI